MLVPRQSDRPKVASLAVCKFKLESSSAFVEGQRLVLRATAKVTVIRRVTERMDTQSLIQARQSQASKTTEKDSCFPNRRHPKHRGVAN